MKKKKMFARATGGIVTTILIASSHSAAVAAQNLSQTPHQQTISRSIDTTGDEDFYTTLAEQGFSPSQIQKISTATRGKSKLY